MMFTAKQFEFLENALNSSIEEFRAEHNDGYVSEDELKEAEQLYESVIQVSKLLRNSPDDTKPVVRICGAEYSENYGRVVTRSSASPDWTRVEESTVSPGVARLLLTKYSDYVPINISYFYFNQIYDSAVETLLKTLVCNPTEDDDKSLWDHGCTPDMLDEQQAEMLLAECTEFVSTCLNYGAQFGKATQADIGQNFILSRNREGAGFWDSPELFGRDYLFINFIAQQYPPLEAYREGKLWTLLGFKPETYEEQEALNSDAE